MRPKKQKVTKVTKEDIDLIEEISLVTTIKGTLYTLASVISEDFEDLLVTALQANPVITYLEIAGKKEKFKQAIQMVQVELLLNLSQVDEETAHELADPEAGIGVDQGVEPVLPNTIEIDKALGQEEE